MAWEGMTSQQRDFIIAITSALEKYSQDHAENVTFSKATKRLISEVNRLDYALRTVGSGGPGMKCSHDFRHGLRDLKKLLSDWEKGLYSPRIWQAVFDLERTTKDLQKALDDFIGITYNEDLDYSLKELCRTLKDYCVTAGYCHIPATKFQGDLAVALVSVQANLARYIDKDVPIIKSVQNDNVRRFTDITVVSTFLSGVTASVLQIVESTTSDRPALTTVVNTSLYSSLVLSTASAVQSLLAIMWFQSFIPLPEKHLPHIVYALLNRGPLISLLVSGAFFSVGLVVFVYLSKQDLVTEIVTTSFATLQTLGVLTLALMFIRTRWKFRQENGVTGRKLTRTSYLFNMMEWILHINSSLSETPSSQDDYHQLSYVSEPWAPSTNDAQVDHEQVRHPDLPNYAPLASHYQLANRDLFPPGINPRGIGIDAFEPTFHPKEPHYYPPTNEAFLNFSKEADFEEKTFVEPPNAQEPPKTEMSWKTFLSVSDKELHHHEHTVRSAWRTIDRRKGSHQAILELSE